MPLFRATWTSKTPSVTGVSTEFFQLHHGSDILNAFSTKKACGPDDHDTPKSSGEEVGVIARPNDRSFTIVTCGFISRIMSLICYDISSRADAVKLTCLAWLRPRPNGYFLRTYETFVGVPIAKNELLQLNEDGACPRCARKEALVGFGGRWDCNSFV